jgi:hypothetical protein
MPRLTTAPLKASAQTSNGTGLNGGELRAEHNGPRARRSRRNLPLVGLGILLVVGCAIGFSSAWLRAGGHQRVLVVAQSVSVGQVLTASDLRTAQLSVASGVASMPSLEMPQVIGRPVTTRLEPGTLLTESDVSTPLGPPAGRAVVGLALKPGQYPPGLATGERILVVLSDGSSTAGNSSSGSSSSSDSTNQTAPLEATVVGVEAAPASSAEALVVSIQLAEGNGAAVATAASAGNVSLAVISSKPSS